MIPCSCFPKEPGNIKNAYLPGLPRGKRIAARLLMGGLQLLANGMQNCSVQDLPAAPQRKFAARRQLAIKLFIGKNSPE